MKAWSAGLAADLVTWPNVRTKSMFGFTAWYRKQTIFALLPKSRCFASADSIAFKLPSAGPRMLARLKADQRIGSTQVQKTKWFILSLHDGADLQAALAWLGRAYEAAK